MDDNELREHGRIARIEAEHAWLAGPDDLVAEPDDSRMRNTFNCLERDPYSDADDGGES